MNILPAEADIDLLPKYYLYKSAVNSQRYPSSVRCFITMSVKGFGSLETATILGTSEPRAGLAHNTCARWRNSCW